jgi:hypothetical protein
MRDLFASFSGKTTETAGKTTESGKLQKPVVDGKTDELGSGVEFKLGHDVGTMGLDGTIGDMEFLGDLGIGVSVGQKPANFLFSRSQ